LSAGTSAPRGRVRFDELPVVPVKEDPFSRVVHLAVVGLLPRQDTRVADLLALGVAPRAQPRAGRRISRNPRRVAPVRRAVLAWADAASHPAERLQELPLCRRSSSGTERLGIATPLSTRPRSTSFCLRSNRAAGTYAVRSASGKRNQQSSHRSRPLDRCEARGRWIGSRAYGCSE
jgi:hypothetical protein